MMTLFGRTKVIQTGKRQLATIYRIEPPGGQAVLVESPGDFSRPADVYIVGDQVTDITPTDAWIIRVPPTLTHLAVGDIVAIRPGGQSLQVLWKASARHNSLLLTEQCDHQCIMCSQPPKERDDAWLYRRAEGVVDLLPAATRQIGFTGGEPTLNAGALLALLGRARDRLPDTDVHLLSNGRRFADADFARSYAALDHPNLMVGIPIYAANATLHDFIVQADGAFAETVRGVLTLAALGQRIELRVVISRQNFEQLVPLAHFIARNLPFVEQVALMGLEMTGLARPNRSLVWVDPVDYRSQLTAATVLLRTAGIKALVFNHQLCVIDQSIWKFAVPSISDWKADYLPACRACDVADRCGGVFATSKGDVSEHIRPVTTASSAIV